MSEQLKQEFETDIDRLEAGTTIDGEIIGNQEKEPAEGKIEDQEGNKTNETDVVQMGKASLADIVSGIPAPTEAEIKAAEAENTKPIKQKAREKLEAEKKKASQKNFADPVITYLLKRCEEDQGLAEDVIQDGKTWDKCFKYIVEQAKKIPRSGNGVAVEDRVVYEWAEDYYHKEDKPEPVKKKSSKKPTAKKSATKPIAKEIKPETEAASEEKKELPVSEWAGNEVSEWADRKLKQDAPKAEKKEKTKKKETPKKTEKPAMEGQMSLFDLL